ncbi:MAG: ABC transporter substrate-binding protein [Chloroflexota bacterium]
MNIRYLLVLLIVSLASVGVQAQDVPAEIPEGETVEITFYSYNLGSAGITAEGTENLIAAFEAEHPNITVNGIGIPAGEITSRVQADLVAGTPPDVAQLIFDDMAFLATNRIATPLEAIVPAEELDEHLGGMVSNGVELGRFEGQTYGLAYTFSTPILFYNADLFRAAGLDPEAPPTNWDEVMEYSLAIREATDAWGIFVATTGRFDWITQSLVLSNGGRVLSEDRTELMFGGPEAIGAIQQMRDLVDAGVMPNFTTGETLDAMSAGDLAMYVQSSAIQSTLVPPSIGNYELRAAVMPGFGDSEAVPTNSGSALFVITQDPLKQRAAWEFMKFVTSREGYTIITSEIGYLPLRPEIVEMDEYLAPYVAENPLILPNLEQLERLQPWAAFPGPNYRQIIQIMQDAVEASIFGDGDVAELMQAAEERASDLMP